MKISGKFSATSIVVVAMVVPEHQGDKRSEKRNDDTRQESDTNKRAEAAGNDKKGSSESNPSRNGNKSDKTPNPSTQRPDDKREEGNSGAGRGKNS